MTRLGGSPAQRSSSPAGPAPGTGYPWQDGDWLYAADLNAGFLPVSGGAVTGIVDIIHNPPDPFINTSPFETHRLMVQIGPNSPVDLGGMSGGTGGPGVAGYFNGISSAITIPGGSTTPSGTQAVAGFVYSLSPFTPGVQNGTAATALYGLAIAGATNVHVWGENLVMCDSPQGAANGCTGQVLNGLEFDCNLFNAGTAVHGVPFYTHFRAAPATGSYAFGTATQSGYQPITYAFGSFQGAAQVALFVGTTTFEPTAPTPSQMIQFSYIDGTGTPTGQNAIMQVVPSTAGGNLVLSTTGGAAMAMGIAAEGSFVCNGGASEYNSAFIAPYSAAGVNAVSFQSGNSPATTALYCGASETTPGTLTPGLLSQKITLNYTITGSATLQTYQLQITPTATGGTLALTGTQDANLSVKSGLGVWGVTPPASRPAFTGAKGGNTALASVIAVLVAAGLATDSTT